jgi:hypothetical protein
MEIFVCTLSRDGARCDGRSGPARPGPIRRKRAFGHVTSGA